MRSKSAKTVRVRAVPASPINCGATLPIRRPRITSTTSSSIKLKPVALARNCFVCENIRSPTHRVRLYHLINVEDGQQDGHYDHGDDDSHEDHGKWFQQSHCR